MEYFSLDVEGKEVEILKTVPFDRIQRDTLSVEYIHGPEKKSYESFMEDKGYITYKDIRFNDKKLYLGAHDFIFVKQSLLWKSVIL